MGRGLDLVREIEELLNAKKRWVGGYVVARLGRAPISRGVESAQAHVSYLDF